MATVASASRGMALRRFPPSMPVIHNGVTSRRACITRASNRLALASPASMSSPECPPLRPPTRIVTAVSPSGTTARSALNAATVSMPPAHPTNTSSRSSESRFIRRGAVIISSPSERAPVNPVSSSTVKSASMGG